MYNLKCCRLVAMISLFTAESAILFHILVWCIGFYDKFYFWVAAGFSLLLHGIHYVGEWYKKKRQNEENRKQIWDRKMLELEDEWLNKLISLLWPHIGNVVRNIVRNEVQQSIRSYSSVFSNLTFTDVDIGDRSPHIAHVHVYGEAATFQNEIVADFDFDFQSNSTIDFKFSRWRAGVSNFSIKGLFRVQLYPLLDELPLVGAVSMCFVEEPEIKYDLTSIANILDFPGFDRLFQYAVAQAVKSMMVLPRKVCIAIDNLVDISQVQHPIPKSLPVNHTSELDYHYRNCIASGTVQIVAEVIQRLRAMMSHDLFCVLGEGIVRITVIEATRLQVQNRSFLSRKFIGMKAPSRPYVVISVGGFEETSKVISGTSNPIWNETFTFRIFDTFGEKISIKIYDDDRILGTDTCIARVSLPVESLYERGLIDQAIAVSQSNNGKLRVKMQWYHLSSNTADMKELGQSQPSNKLLRECLRYLCYLLLDTIAIHHAREIGIKETAFLSIYVEGAKYLVPANENQQDSISPLVKITIDNELFKTYPAGSVNPFWKENFQTCLKQPDNRVIAFEIIDSNKKNALGILNFNVKRLMIAPGMTMDEDFPLRNAGTNSMLHLRLTLRILVQKLRVARSASVPLSFTINAPGKDTRKRKTSTSSWGRTFAKIKGD